MIQFDSKDLFYKQPFGAVKVNTLILFRIKLQENGPAQGAILVISDDTGIVERLQGTAVASVDGENVYSFTWQAQRAGLFFYYFKTYEYADIRSKTNTFQLTVYSEDYQTPEWMKKGVMYQIFPDRFARSIDYDPPQQDKDYILREDWGGIPEITDKYGITKNRDFFGGNLRGIIERLDYLKDLGITAIYLNPIFEAYSNHRYDTGNYTKIDPVLGTEADFTKLCQEARDRGIKIILDGVFSHTGSDSVYFNKYGRYKEIGAYQSKTSPYYSWYRFIEYPDKYESWWGIDTLPNVNETDPSFLDYIVKGENSVVKRWLRNGASGYRLDVADELPDEFIDEIRIAVKSVKEDAVLIGEVWEDASNKIAYGQRRRYLQGRQLDSVMNYPLKNGLIDFLVYSQDACKLQQIVNGLWENYPKPAFNSLMNILGTHDTVRIMTVLSDIYEDEEFCRQRYFLALLIWAMLPGIPCIYYGDELGMKGGRDPMNRLCFEPAKGDLNIFKFYKRLLAFRNTIDDLAELEYTPGPAQGGYYSFYRKNSQSQLIIAVNADEEDYVLDLELEKLEQLKDFFISGSVVLKQKGVFHIKANSGVIAYVRTKKTGQFSGIS